ncbi:colicin [Desmospora sp. 8437]|nr:colicin [Desmospora sp. 8437]
MANTPDVTGKFEYPVVSHGSFLYDEDNEEMALYRRFDGFITYL